ncbi:MAG: helix-turn-helix transcriptional regulator [Rhizomicrobium sp.]
MPMPQPQLARLLSGRLRLARELRKLSQRVLGRRARIPPSAIARFEVGARMPTIESLRRLASALDIPTDYLLGLVDIPGLVGTDEIVGQDIDLLSDSDRELTRKIVRILVKRNQEVNLGDEGLKQISSG